MKKFSVLFIAAAITASVMISPASARLANDKSELYFTKGDAIIITPKGDTAILFALSEAGWTLLTRVSSGKRLSGVDKLSGNGVFCFVRRTKNSAPNNNWFATTCGVDHPSYAVRPVSFDLTRYSATPEAAIRQISPLAQTANRVHRMVTALPR
ncbi:MAG: hypothetical protein A2808_02840 [Candidatus Moranbacteria bacterium RIFCSPHIGHO2_01_FULL_55_24]|nr:MAG: hypothetical protein A2808_02840 [Candidatus Moranbacteria bacterium RIFCSPHIGHO2_01_FULL_55_24]